MGIVLTAIVNSCKIEPEPINFGLDVCAYCSMTIVDRQRASQVVSDKGKVAKFDAIECMINHLEEVDPERIGMVLCTTYEAPGELYDATRATYLVSPELPSPMGANLTAFGDDELARETVENVSGELYNWEEIRPLIAR